MPISDVAWAIDDLTRRAPYLRRRRAYYEGRHDPVLPDGKTLSRVMRDLLDDLNDNLCDDVVEEPCDRLVVTNWDVEGEDRAAVLNDWWDNTRGAARFKDTMRASLWAGDGFSIIQRNRAQQVRKYVQRPESMAVRYSEDEPDAIEVAAKAVKVGKRWRITLYYSPVNDDDGVTRPDGVEFGQPWCERYMSRGSGAEGALPQAKNFSPVVDADGQGKDVEVLEGDRIPVFHYPNDEVGRYGRSALSDVIPLQNVLNKSVCDLVVAMEGYSLPIRWATGIQVEYDPVTGDEKALWRPGVERLVRTGNKDATFGQFPAADLTQLLETQGTYRLEIARKGRLPLHSVRLDAGSGNAPSGLSLLVAEGRQVKRVKAMQDEDGLVLREEAAYALTLMGHETTVDEIDLEWAPAETRDEQGLMETLTVKVESLGLPQEQALIEAGYDPEDAKRWAGEAAQAKEQARADAMDGGRISDPGLQGGMMPVPVGLPGAPAPAAVA